MFIEACEAPPPNYFIIELSSLILFRSSTNRFPDLPKVEGEIELFSLPVGDLDRGLFLFFFRKLLASASF